ncbi:ABC transporter ATP-binding protein [Microbacterium sp. PI-1]|uniref:ABC transporter ATP-binding protein n=1 Tax=Microbacterium sp. PI-1 TaxID=2545631 RepID=UPI00103D58FF|nr:ABC transporter ATP-binding protein [Microbacterium sp. PI-1]TCJ21951.1 ABC transporter ATP-binding protein [Microbacterium sp. PI-1]
MTKAASVDTMAPSSEVVPLLRVENFSLDLAPSGEFVPVLSNVDLTIRTGEVVGLVGESGSGKSTLALSLIGLVPQKISKRRGGRIVLDDTEITGGTRRALQSVRGRKIGMIFQEPMTALDPAYRVGDQVAEAIRRHTGVSRAEARRRTIENFKLVEIADAERRADAYPHELSGGLRQRVCIALAIACRPQLLIADEPTTALDVTTQAQILQLLRRLREELGMAIILISHDLAVIAEFCDRVMVMYAGQIVEESPIDPFFIQPRHPYSSALLQSLPENQLPLKALSVLPGSPPSLGMQVPGCRFVARCAHAQSGRCDVTPIEMTNEPPRAFRCIRADELTLPGAAR